ncbi:MAG: VOC family protein [Rhodospirillales bacterium]
MADLDREPPGLMFSHFGIYCADLEPLEAFYTGVMGFNISDKGPVGNGLPMTFMTRRPREHHQFVLGAGRAKGIPSTVFQTGFKAPSLAELRRIRDMLAAVPGLSDIVAADHGISWTLYFRDMEGNRVAISVETPWYVPQPAAWPLDLAQPDAAIEAATEARCRATAGFMPRDDWRQAKHREFVATGRFTTEVPATGNPQPDFDVPFDPQRQLMKNGAAASPPRIAMSHVGLYAIDMDRVIGFYTRVLGYAVTGRGTMPAIGQHPAADVVYMTRDPGEHQQIMFAAGRAKDTPSSCNQLSLRITSLSELRRLEQVLKDDPEAHDIEYVNHGNSFSLYFKDCEDNRIECAVESVWYVPAPNGWFLDLSKSDADLIQWTENAVREKAGFMMRAEWMKRAREEMIAKNRIEAENLVRDAAARAGTTA